MADYYFKLALIASLPLFYFSLHYGLPQIYTPLFAFYLCLGSYAIYERLGGRGSADLFHSSFLSILILALLSACFAALYGLDLLAIYVIITSYLLIGLTLMREGELRLRLPRRKISALHYLSLCLIALQIAILVYLDLDKPVEIWKSKGSYSLLPLFFLNVLSLLALSLRSDRSCLWLIVIQSIVAHSFFVAIYETGYGWDAWVHLGWINRMDWDPAYLHRELSTALAGKPLLKAVIRVGPAYCARPAYYGLMWLLMRLFNLHGHRPFFAILPLLWGTYLPLIAFSLSKVLFKREDYALLSALATLAYPTLILWGAVNVPNSLGYLVLAFYVYLASRWLAEGRGSYLLASLVTLTTLLVIHPLPGVWGVVSFVLTLIIKALRPGSFKWALVLTFLASLPLPLLAYLGGYGKVSYRFLYGPKPLWEKALYLTLGGIYPKAVKAHLYYGPLVAIGFVLVKIALPIASLMSLPYCFKEGRGDLTCLLTALIFASVLDNRFIYLFMGRPFAGPSRISVLGHLFEPVLAPALLSRLIRRKNVSPLAKVAIALLLTASLFGGYPYRYGYLGVTASDIDAVKFIGKVANGTYAVLCYNWLKLAAYPSVGLENPKAFYPSVYNWAYRHYYKLITGNPEDVKTVKKVLAKVCEERSVNEVFIVVSEERLSEAHKVASALTRWEPLKLAGVVDGKIYVLKCNCRVITSSKV